MTDDGDDDATVSTYAKLVHKHREFASHIPPLYLPRPKDDPPEVVQAQARLRDQATQKTHIITAVPTRYP